MAVRINISLIGCGWLGFPLAKKLLAQGYNVRGSTTSESKTETLKEAGVDPYLVQYSSGKPLPDLDAMLKGDVLIVTIPPGRTTDGGFDNYRLMVDHLFSELKKQPKKKLIFISSTSVYEDLGQECYEYTPPSPKTESGKLLLQTEIKFASLHHNLTVLRLSGLIGPSRHPSRFFAGKRNIPGGLSPVNLIHLEDATGIIMNLIADDFIGILNGCAPSHPSRRDFYTRAAAVKGLELPEFQLNDSDKKIISSTRIKELNYDFIYPELMNWVEKSAEE